MGISTAFFLAGLDYGELEERVQKLGLEELNFALYQCDQVAMSMTMTVTITLTSTGTLTVTMTMTMIMTLIMTMTMTFLC